MHHVKRSDPTIESAIVEALRVPATAHRYTLSLKDSGAVRGVYDSVETARAAAPGVAGPKGTYRVTAVHPVECPCSPTDRMMDGDD
jgi:hypothetical protein